LFSSLRLRSRTFKKYLSHFPQTDQREIQRFISFAAAFPIQPWNLLLFTSSNLQIEVTIDYNFLLQLKSCSAVLSFCFSFARVKVLVHVSPLLWRLFFEILQKELVDNY
jgi:hypothetical protein